MNDTAISLDPAVATRLERLKARAAILDVRGLLKVVADGKGERVILKYCE